MWGVGVGDNWNYRHFFKREDGVWSALCGLWTRAEPKPQHLPACYWCDQKKREAERHNGRPQP